VDQRINVLRFDADGTFDPTFGIGGEVITDVPGTSNDFASSGLQLSDSKIVVAGESVVGGVPRFMVARYHPTGALDTSFHMDGIAFADFPEGNAETAWAVAESGGRIIAAGRISNGGGVQMAVARWHATGVLDTSFGGDGMVTIPFAGANALANGVAVTRDGKIVVAGYAFVGASSTFAVARLNANGTLDSSFDGDGRMTVSFPGATSAVAMDVTVLRNAPRSGWVAIGGFADVGAIRQFAVALLRPDGILEAAFDGDGRRLLVFPGATEQAALSVAADDLNRIVLGGSAAVGNGQRFALARLTTTGALDPAFSGDGFSVIDFSETPAESINDIAIRPGGAIAATGPATQSLSAFATAVARFHADGSLNTSFSGDGKLVRDAANVAFDVGQTVVFSANDRITVIGYRGQPAVR
jgi:uncharacterized delta-60 repeat protein